MTQLNHPPKAEAMGRTAGAPKAEALVPIREIGARYRSQIAAHLKALEPQDRYLRFGYAASDAQIQQYVDHIDFSRDEMLGIFNRKLELIALAHLAFAPDFTDRGFAEFGVSVASHARGRGYGSRLFERAAIHAVNDGVQMLYVHTLSENTAMIKIARRAGATVERAGSETEAHLKLPVASLRTRVDELMGDQLGQIDYWFKSGLKNEHSLAREVLGVVQEVREAVREGRHKSGS